MSEMFNRNVCTLKNKYDLTFCQSRLHTASEMFVHHKKIWIGFDFCVFRIRGKHFERCFDSSEPPYKQMPKLRMAIVKFIHFISQHKAHIDPCTLSSQKLSVFFLTRGSNIASKASNCHPEVNFESPVTIPLLLNMEGELPVLYILGSDGPNISFIFLLRSERTTKSPSMLE